MELPKNPIPQFADANWETILETKTNASIFSWWDSFSQWVTLSLYDQIHKIELIEVWVDGALTSRTAALTLSELKFLALSHQLPTVVAYKRRVYPRDYQRKSEVEDFVFFLLHDNRVIYRPTLPDNDPTKLSYFYVQATSFAFELLNSPSLHESLCGPDAAKLPSPTSQVFQPQDVRFSVIPFESTELHHPDRLAKVAAFQVKCLDRWDKSFRAGGYTKRVHHDLVVPLDLFTAHYRRLKERYHHWVADWEESTDPAKFVFEDVGIAAFLIAVWELQSPFKRPSFVDLGCGNGFLVYILAMEGYVGRGIDLVKRKIWAKYPEGVRLEEAAIDPTSSVYEEDWIIANHSDELTPWVPLIASRNNRSFFTLPCCEFDFPGTRYSMRTKTRSRYESYIDYVTHIAQESGYQIDVEHLRIPSTRNIALLGKTRTVDPNNPEHAERISQQQEQLLRNANFVKFEARAAPPKSHVQVAKKDRPKKFRGTMHPGNLQLASAQPSNDATGHDGCCAEDNDNDALATEAKMEQNSMQMDPPISQPEPLLP